MTRRPRLHVLALAALTAGCGRAPDRAGFVDVTAASGVPFTHTNGATGKKLLPETMGAGVGVLDFDGDGHPDLVFVNGRRWPGDPGPATTLALFRNRGDGTFEDRTAGSGLEVEVQGMGVAVGDFDNDGRPDLFVTAVGGNKLFRNLGGRFEDVTDRAGVDGGKPWAKPSNFCGTNIPVLFPASGDVAGLRRRRQARPVRVRVPHHGLRQPTGTSTPCCQAAGGRMCRRPSSRPVGACCTATAGTAASRT